GQSHHGLSGNLASRPGVDSPLPGHDHRAGPGLRVVLPGPGVPNSDPGLCDTLGDLGLRPVRDDRRDEGPGPGIPASRPQDRLLPREPAAARLASNPEGSGPILVGWVELGEAQRNPSIQRVLCRWVAITR